MVSTTITTFSSLHTFDRPSKVVVGRAPVERFVHISNEVDDILDLNQKIQKKTPNNWKQHVCVHADFKHKSLGLKPFNSSDLLY